MLTIFRTVIGTLKGYDQLMNLVLDDVKETMRGTWDMLKASVVSDIWQTMKVTRIRDHWALSSPEAHYSC
jgi:small nuclear ribonucleoprotein (snRNP)-like protein